MLGKSALSLRRCKEILSSKPPGKQYVITQGSISHMLRGLHCDQKLPYLLPEASILAGVDCHVCLVGP